ncbi:MarR family transcriptional regulator [uncultured Pseudoflavonifractor sp.]|uniref:MarR family winged helix-turn-helix transcriptional regulator n=1 Tax=uncultured Pseudoflavonifractor sp. TaxID=1221379 RepID=UPI0025CEC7A2|nr:MarR family transcriptional regulator [uncultured Pseudoflavonifractor sp.]
MEHRETERALFRALHRFGKLNTGQIIEMEGLTQGEFFGLSMLREHLKAHPEGMHVRELAGKARVSPPRVSRMLRDMEERSLIERRIDRNDRRNTYIYLTEQGEAAWNRTAERLSTFLDRVVDRMGLENVQTMIDLWNQFSEILEDERAKETEQC